MRSFKKRYRIDFRGVRRMFDYGKELDGSWTTTRILETLYDDIDEYVAYMKDGGTDYRLRTLLMMREVLTDSFDGLEVLDRYELVGRLVEFVQTDIWVPRVEMMVWGYYEAADYRELVEPEFPGKEWKKVNADFVAMDKRSRDRGREEEELENLTLDVSKQVRVVVHKVLRELFIDEETRDRVRSKTAEFFARGGLRLVDVSKDYVDSNDDKKED